MENPIEVSVPKYENIILKKREEENPIDSYVFGVSTKLTSITGTHLLSLTRSLNLFLEGKGIKSMASILTEDLESIYKFNSSVNTISLRVQDVSQDVLGSLDEFAMSYKVKLEEK
jgi:hypothetical protein